MLVGLWRLTWLELKIFMREPLGLIGTVITPVLIFLVLERLGGPHASQRSRDLPRSISVDLPILCSLLITTSTVLSLTAIIAIYREGGILRRLRATPLRPFTILAAHVLVKLLLTAVTLAAMLLAGRRYAVAEAGVPLVSFAVALLFSTVSLSSLGFLIASLVPTARFAQPLGALILLPDDWCFRAIRAPRIAAADDAGCGPGNAAHLRRVAPARNLARGRLVSPHGGRDRLNGCVSGAQRGVVQSLSMGVKAPLCVVAIASGTAT